ncbi:MAG: homoserine kinase [Acidimicrobiia bacterium]|nr:homoserine kinase [Acidimicrobiia bacterium]NNC75359.1 homoserine kinase [Acidimicrobiia bacterium]
MTGLASAPASAANLGPGFDVLALALEIRCSVKVAVADEWYVTEPGRDRVPQEDELVVKAARAVTSSPLHVEINSSVPIGRGLGSSAALTTATVAAAARALGDELELAELFSAVTELEGHADNAAAAVYGGLVASVGGRPVRLQVHPSLTIVVGVPEAKLSTGKARSVMPDGVGLDGLVGAVARTVALVAGMRDGDGSVLRLARGDDVHEVARESLSPVSSRLIEAALDAGALHAAWSGAGPSALAVVDEVAVEAVCDAMAEVLGDEGEVLTPDIAVDGVI